MTIPGAITYPLHRPDTRRTINTPGLVLDLDVLERNIAVMAERMRATGRLLRPHAKSHKCPEIAQAQIAAGAVGICCATLDEAEVMAAHALEGILITSPVTTPEKIERVTALLNAAPDTRIVVDHPDNAIALGEAVRRAGRKLGVLIDIEVGFGRTGVVDADAAEALARVIAEQEALRLDGVQAYGGHLQHTADYRERLALCTATHQFVAGIVARLAAIGMPPLIVSGGGTGTHDIDSTTGPFTELQAGSYVFMDAEYETIVYRENAGWPFGNALFVQTAVISTNAVGMVTTDAGVKAFALNGAPPRVVEPGLEAAQYSYLGDEHGRLSMAAGTTPPALGARVECVPSHCDPTVALYDRYHCVRGDMIVDIWPIAARGRR